MNDTWNNKYQLFFKNFYLESKKINVSNDLGIITSRNVSDFTSTILNKFLDLPDECFFINEFFISKKVKNIHIICTFYIKESDGHKIITKYSDILDSLKLFECDTSVFRKYRGSAYISQKSLNEILKKLTDSDIEETSKYIRVQKNIYAYIQKFYKLYVKGAITDNKIIINDRLQYGELKNIKEIFKSLNIKYKGKDQYKEFSIYEIQDIDNLKALLKISGFNIV